MLLCAAEIFHQKIDVVLLYVQFKPLHDASFSIVPHEQDKNLQIQVHNTSPPVQMSRQLSRVTEGSIGTSLLCLLKIRKLLLISI